MKSLIQDLLESSIDQQEETPRYSRHTKLQDYVVTAQWHDPRNGVQTFKKTIQVPTYLRARRNHPQYRAVIDKALSELAKEAGKEGQRPVMHSVSLPEHSSGGQTPKGINPKQAQVVKKLREQGYREHSYHQDGTIELVKKVGNSSLLHAHVSPNGEES